MDHVFLFFRFPPENRTSRRSTCDREPVRAHTDPRPRWRVGPFSLLLYFRNFTLNRHRRGQSSSAACSLAFCGPDFFIAVAQHPEWGTPYFRGFARGHGHRRRDHAPATACRQLVQHQRDPPSSSRRCSSSYGAAPAIYRLSRKGLAITFSKGQTFRSSNHTHALDSLGPVAARLQPRCTRLSAQCSVLTGSPGAGIAQTFQRAA